jgi:hypothetical protein
VSYEDAMTFTSSKIALSVALVALNLSACSKNAPPAEDASTETSASEAAPLAPVTESSEQYYVEGVAGGVMVSSVELEAEVVSVDQNLRQAVLRGPEGREVVVSVGKEAVNFYQVKPGDRVKVAIQRELQIYVPEGEQDEPDGTAVAEARAAQGESPAGMVVASSKVSSKITAMDLEARTATLTFEDGSAQTFDVRPDVDMTKYEVGQEVVFLITEMLAIEVETL